MLQGLFTSTADHSWAGPGLSVLSLIKNSITSPDKDSPTLERPIGSQGLVEDALSMRHQSWMETNGKVQSGPGKDPISGKEAPKMYKKVVFSVVYQGIYNYMMIYVSWYTR